MTYMSRLVTFSLSLFLTLSVAFIGSFVTVSSLPTWYEALEKPPFTPPNEIFAPVWTILYMLMSVALYRVWRESAQNPLVRSAIWLFFLQLALSALWSILFFGFKNPLAALVDIIILLVLIALTIKKFYAQDHLAAWLLLPYLFWVAFATYLNASLWYLNRFA